MTNTSFLDAPTLRSDDGLPIQNTSPDLLNMALVQQHIHGAVERGRYNGPTDPETYLHTQHCLVTVATQTYATMAGLLCFGHNPQLVFPHAVVDLGHYRGVDVASFEVIHLEKGIRGTIFDQIERVETYLWANTHHGMTLGDSAKRIELHEYPRAAIRELGVNMLAHRDYTRGGATARVQLFRDRIEWISPGGLPPRITLDNLLDEQWSRNPIILAILYEAGYVEAFGQGLNTVVTVLQSAGMPAPQFRDTGASFIVTVTGRSLDGFVAADPTARLSERQRDIRVFVRDRGEVTPRQVVERFQHLADARSIQRDLQALVDSGILVREGWGRSVRYFWASSEPTES
jgi:ATP-dependent DNA helicase RecG